MLGRSLPGVKPPCTRPWPNDDGWLHGKNKRPLTSHFVWHGQRPFRPPGLLLLLQLISVLGRIKRQNHLGQVTAGFYQNQRAVVRQHNDLWFARLAHGHRLCGNVGLNLGHFVGI